MVFISSSNEGESHLSLLVMIQQINGKPLPVGMFTERIMGKTVEKITGVCPEGVTKLNEFDVLLEFSPREAIEEVEIAKKIQRISSGWGCC